MHEWALYANFAIFILTIALQHRTPLIREHLRLDYQYA